jgi:transketolase C-terminal domain/subunit
MESTASAPVATFDCRVAFAETLIELAGVDERIVAVCNDSVGSSNLVGFQKAFPDRLINVGNALAGRGLWARVLNVSTIKPLDDAEIIAAARETKAIVTVEEAVIEGGLGAAVAEMVVRHAPVPMRMLGVSGFAPTGAVEFLFNHFGLTRDGIVAAALELKEH